MSTIAKVLSNPRVFLRHAARMEALYFAQQPSPILFSATETFLLYLAQRASRTGFLPDMGWRAQLDPLRCKRVLADISISHLKSWSGRGEKMIRASRILSGIHRPYCTMTALLAPLNQTWDPLQTGTGSDGDGSWNTTNSLWSTGTDAPTSTTARRRLSSAKEPAPPARSRSTTHR